MAQLLRNLPNFTSHKWESLDLNPDSLIPEPVFSTLYYIQTVPPKTNKPKLLLKI